MPTIQDGKIYTATPLNPKGKTFAEVQKAFNRRTSQGFGKKVEIVESYDIKWKKKPFPYSYSKEFKPRRRFFYHGAPLATVKNILDSGFIIQSSARTGRMLGDGVYSTYHFDKSLQYAPEQYIISVMVYAPNTLLLNPNQQIDAGTIKSAPQKGFDAIEVRTDSIVMGHRMRLHEICVFSTMRIIPKFISKVQVSQ